MSASCAARLKVSRSGKYRRIAAIVGPGATWPKRGRIGIPRRAGGGARGAARVALPACAAARALLVDERHALARPGIGDLVVVAGDELVVAARATELVDVAIVFELIGQLAVPEGLDAAARLPGDEDVVAAGGDDPVAAGPA